MELAQLYDRLDETLTAAEAKLLELKWPQDKDEIEDCLVQYRDSVEVLRQAKRRTSWWSCMEKYRIRCVMQRAQCLLDRLNDIKEGPPGRGLPCVLYCLACICC